MRDYDIYKKTLSQIDYYVYALCEVVNNKKIPFYIGKGKGGRCLHHLSNNENGDKSEKISKLIELGGLHIDILRHGIKDEETARLVESTCIDLIGVGDLTNKVRGAGKDLGRISIDELHNLLTNDAVRVLPEHSGIAFILNKTYKSGMSAIQLYESTRGVWAKVPRSKEIKFAYATYAGIVKEVYEVHGWVKAGTQQYFTRNIKKNPDTNRWEFIGRIADDSVRNKYIGKIIDKDRSFGDPFVKVGFN